MQLAARTQFPVQLIHKNWGSVAKEMLRESEFCLWVYYSGKYIIQLPMSMVTILEFPKPCVHSYNHQEANLQLVAPSNLIYQINALTDIQYLSLLTVWGQFCMAS